MIDMTAEEDMETWVPVVGFEGHYEVSDQGRVRSCDRFVKWYGTQKFYSGKVMRLQRYRTGHLTVRLYRDGSGKTIGVHRLVLEAFTGPPPPGVGLECCHRDSNPANNALTNLRWDTRRNNTFDAVEHGSHHQASKTQCPQGHEYTPENTYIYKRRRNCRSCRRDRRLAGRVGAA